VQGMVVFGRTITAMTLAYVSFDDRYFLLECTTTGTSAKVLMVYDRMTDTILGQLDLAQFRDLEAFAQFASDLDKATRDRIERGRRILEVLKQPQYQPVPVEKQIVIMYAANSGYMDDVQLNLVSAWESGLYRYLDANYTDILNEIIEKSVAGREKMSKDLLNRLGQAIEDYKKTAAPRAEQS